MKIAIASEFPLMQQGGTEVLVRELMRGVSPHYEVVLVSGDPDRSVFPTEYAQLIADHFYWDSKSATVDSAKKLAASLIKARTRLAHFHFGGTFEWSSNRFWRCPIHHLGGSDVVCISTNHLAVEWLKCGVNPARPRWQKELFQWFSLASRSLIYRRLRVEVCVSEHDRKRVVAMFPFFRRKILRRYHSLLPREAPPFDTENREPVILCVGMIGGRKAQPILAEAFARIARKHPTWRLNFIGRVGDADYVRQIQASATRYQAQSQVQMLGWLDDDETLRRMQRASVIAMPSVQEGLGLSLQEALFWGCVGVGSRAGGIPELIEHGVNGLIVPPGDVPALSAALDKLLSEPGLLARFRSETRASILRKEMNAELMVEYYFSLYRNSLNGRPSTPA